MTTKFKGNSLTSPHKSNTWRIVVQKEENIMKGPYSLDFTHDFQS